MADGGYIAVFEKSEARIYDGTTTTITALKDPLLVAPRCTNTGLWKLDLGYEVLSHEYPKQFIAGVDAANAIFDLPDNHQTLAYYHAAAGFPTKRINMVMGYKSNGHGQGGHLTWSSPPLFMVN
jgi:hypothetical protein